MDAASLATNTPLSGAAAIAPVSVNGEAAANQAADFYDVAPGYFQTTGVSLLAGRDFSDRDVAGAPAVAIVNQTFLRRYLPGAHPPGRRISVPMFHDSGMEIIGVAADAISESMREAPPPTVYVSFYQYQSEAPVFVVHASGTLTQIAAELRRTLQPFLPETAIQIHTLSAQVDAAMIQERLLASLGAAFAPLALLLAAIGIYSLLAYVFARRATEMGVRAALGAGRAELIWLVIRRALRMLGLGIAAGVPLALAVSRAIQSMLFGITAADPVTLTGAAALLVAIGLAAAFLPARRAANADPMSVLRCE